MTCLTTALELVVTKRVLVPTVGNVAFFSAVGARKVPLFASSDGCGGCFRLPLYEHRKFGEAISEGIHHVLDIKPTGIGMTQDSLGSECGLLWCN